MDDGKKTCEYCPNYKDEYDISYCVFWFWGCDFQDDDFEKCKYYEQLGGE